MVEELKYFDTQQITLSSTTASKYVYKLRGGETILIKAKSTNTGIIYFGKKDVSSTTGYPLTKGEAVEVAYSPDKPIEWTLEIYAIASTANDVVCILVVPAP